MESQPDQLASETASQTSSELRKLQDRVDRMVARVEGGQPLTVQSMRLLDGLVLEVMKQQILNARERDFELLECARMRLESVLPAKIAELLKTESGVKRAALVKKLRSVSELSSTLCEAASPSVFNPLDYKVLARSIAFALDDSDAYVMPPIRRFVGVGVYAL